MREPFSIINHTMNASFTNYGTRKFLCRVWICQLSIEGIRLAFVALFTGALLRSLALGIKWAGDFSLPVNVPRSFRWRSLGKNGHGETSRREFALAPLNHSHCRLLYATMHFSARNISPESWTLVLAAFKKATMNWCKSFLPIIYPCPLQSSIDL